MDIFTAEEVKLMQTTSVMRLANSVRYSKEADWLALRDLIEALGPAQELRTFLVKWRPKIRNAYPGTFEQLPTTHPSKCRWEGMIREQFDALSELIKATSAMMACDPKFVVGHKYLKECLLGMKEEFEPLVKEFETLFQDHKLLELGTEALLGLVEAMADATKDMLDVKIGVYDKFLKKDDSSSSSGTGGG